MKIEFTGEPLGKVHFKNIYFISPQVCDQREGKWNLGFLFIEDSGVDGASVCNISLCFDYLIILQ